MTTKFLAIDVETGGIGPEYSLLSAYFLALDDKFNKIDDLYLFMKPDDGIYHVCGEAMNVNRIDLKTHDTKALTYRESGTKLYKWLQNLTSDGKIKPYLLGHNVKGDKDKIIQFLMSRGSWEKFISHRLRDTQTSAGFLVDAGILPHDLSCGLGSLVKYFGIPFNENEMHDAKVDTEKTVEVYKALTNILLKLKNSEDISNDKPDDKPNERIVVEYGYYDQEIEDEISEWIKDNSVNRVEAIISIFNK